MNYFILHGSFGSPFGNWFPYLRSEIEKKGLCVYTPDMPCGVGFQNYNNWSKIMDAYVEAGIVNEDTIIFAHSIAPIFICKYLVERNIKVKRLVLVCGFNNYLGINEEYDAVNESMYFDDLVDVKKCCRDIICFYSDNDPYVSFDKEKEFADMIANKQVIIPNGGHLNSESDYSEFKELLEYI